MNLIRKSDGMKVDFQHEDRGTSTPATCNGVPYRAYTSWIRVDGPTGEAAYVQTDAKMADIAGDVLLARANHLEEVLDKMGYAFEAHWTEEERKRAPWA